MKVACILLTCGRADLTHRIINQNLFNAHKDADVFLVDNASPSDEFLQILASYPFTKAFRFDTNRGIATAINKGIELAMKTDSYDGFVTLANDILMPEYWLERMCYWAEQIPETGMIGVHCVEALPPLSDRGVHEIFTPFGNALITRKVVDMIGGFNTDFDPYGMQDADYAYRLYFTGGFINYYVPELKSEHIGHDVGTDSEYRRMKDAGLTKAGDILGKALEDYKQRKNLFIPWAQ